MESTGTDQAEAERLAAKVAPGAEPVKAVPDEVPPDADPATRTLGSLLRRTPLLDHFESVAHRSFQQATAQERMAAARQAYPIHFWLCRSGDFLLRALVAFGIVLIALAVAYKALAPFAPVV